VTLRDNTVGLLYVTYHTIVYTPWANAYTKLFAQKYAYLVPCTTIEYLVCVRHLS
jgi:hypothetical protein